MTLPAAFPRYEGSQMPFTKRNNAMAYARRSWTSEGGGRALSESHASTIKPVHSTDTGRRPLSRQRRGDELAGLG